MSQEAPQTIPVRILDKEYQVQCPPDEVAALQQSALVVDQRMREIRKSGSVIGLERIAIMTALNLSYDLFKAENRAETNESSKRGLARLDRKLSKALEELNHTSV